MKHIYKNIFRLFIHFVFFLISCDNCTEPFSYELSDQFSVNPSDAVMTVDYEKGYIYTANPWYPKISQYDQQGKQLRLLDLSTGEQGDYEYYIPVDLIVDEANDIFALTNPCIKNADNEWIPLNGFSIIKYDNEFRYKYEFYFTELNVSWLSIAMTYKNGILYVTNGKHLMKINADDGSYTIFNLPKQNDENSYYHTSGVAIDSDNNIWVVGAYNWFPENPDNWDDWEVGVQITQFDSNYQNQKTYIAQGRSKEFGSFSNQPGITFDFDNNMYLTTGYCQSVEIYDFNMNIQKEIMIDEKRSFPTDIAIDYNEILYVLDSSNDRVLIYE